MVKNWTPPIVNLGIIFAEYRLLNMWIMDQTLKKETVIVPMGMMSVAMSGDKEDRELVERES